jgi:hypothetical protein
MALCALRFLAPVKLQGASGSWCWARVACGTLAATSDDSEDALGESGGELLGLQPSAASADVFGLVS